jgi:hypothetical protein
MVKVSVGRDAIDDDLTTLRLEAQSEAHHITSTSMLRSDRCRPNLVFPPTCSPSTSSLLNRQNAFALPGGSRGDKSQCLHIPYDSQRHPPVPTHQAQCAHTPTPLRPTAVQILHCHKQTSQRQKDDKRGVSLPAPPPHLSPPPYMILCIYPFLTIHVPMCMMGVLTRAM